jgi:hypothetical protein
VPGWVVRFVIAGFVREFFGMATTVQPRALVEAHERWHQAGSAWAPATSEPADGNLARVRFPPPPPQPSELIGELCLKRRRIRRRLCDVA